MDHYSNEFNFLEKALANNPDNYFFHQQMSYQLMIKKDYEGAARECGEAIRIQPSRALFYNNRANIYTSMGRLQDALRDYDSALVKSNYDPLVYLNRAVTLSELGQFDDAMNELRRLKQCCQQMIPKKAEQDIVMRWTVNGLNKIEELLEKQPNNAVLYANRAKLYFDSGQMKEALADKEKALSLDPTNEQIKLFLEKINP